MSDILRNTINDLGEKIAMFDTGAMFQFTPLKQALHRGSALRPERDRPLSDIIQEVLQKAAVTQARRQRDKCAKEPRSSQIKLINSSNKIAWVKKFSATVPPAVGKKREIY